MCIFTCMLFFVLFRSLRGGEGRVHFIQNSIELEEKAIYIYNFETCVQFLHPINPGCRTHCRCILTRNQVCNVGGNKSMNKLNQYYRFWLFSCVQVCLSASPLQCNMAGNSREHGHVHSQLHVRLRPCCFLSLHVIGSSGIDTYYRSRQHCPR